MLKWNKDGKVKWSYMSSMIFLDMKLCSSSLTRDSLTPGAKLILKEGVEEVVVLNGKKWCVLYVEYKIHQNSSSTRRSTYYYYYYYYCYCYSLGWKITCNVFENIYIRNHKKRKIRLNITNY